SFPSKGDKLISFGLYVEGLVGLKGAFAMEYRRNFREENFQLYSKKASFGAVGEINAGGEFKLFENAEFFTSNVDIYGKLAIEAGAEIESQDNRNLVNLVVVFKP